MNLERLNTNSRLGRHVARLAVEVRGADRLSAPERRALLRGAARQFMQAGFHQTARELRRQTRRDDK